MPLDFDTPFFEDLIYYAEELAPRHPVFMLYGYERDRLVIKQELQSASEQDIKFNTKIMSAVDRNAKVKVLTPGEVQALRKWAAAFKWDRDSGATLVEQALAHPGNWTKMKTYQLVALDSAAKKRGTGDKSDVRFIAATLNAPGGLKKLGEIIAADLFNGNSDRFSFGDGINWNGHQLKSLVNVGNVFVAVDPNQQGSVIGLDSLEAASMYRDHSIPLRQAEANSVDKWSGRLLADNAHGQRMQFAQDIVDDLNTVLGPRSRKLLFANQKRLTDNAAIRVNAGMESGATKIRQRIARYFGKHRAWPVGLQDRFGELGWFAKIV